MLGYSCRLTLVELLLMRELLGKGSERFKMELSRHSPSAVIGSAMMDKGYSKSFWKT